MKCAAEFRAIAREALRGRWGTAVIAGIIASILGGTGGGSTPEITFTQEVSGGVTPTVTMFDQPLFTVGERIAVAGAITYILLIGLVAVAIALFLGSVVEVGYSRFHLNLVDGQEASIGQLFSYFPHWKTTVIASLLRGIYIVLWTLLLIIPGIVASYSYAMTPYILADDPDMTASEAISASKAMMEGNRWRLFCLELSFIGWSLLSALTLGIGHLWLNPYSHAARAAFYREISGTEAAYTPPEPPPLWENTNATWDER